MRKSLIKRNTAETRISLNINLDGRGKADIHTPIGFLNHMLNLLARHGLLDLQIKADGDTEVDIHHTNEDIGICLGLALKEAAGNKEGIRRFGFASVPLDEALVEVSLDLSGRPYLKVKSQKSPAKAGSRQILNNGREKVKNNSYDINYLTQFLQALVNNAGITLHVEILSGEDGHHIIEAAFKALGRSLKEALSIDPRIKGILSTKGRL